MRSIRPVYVPVEPRMEIVMKAAIRELALVLGQEYLVPAAISAGIDKEALLLCKELEALSAQKTVKQYDA